MIPTPLLFSVIFVVLAGHRILAGEPDDVHPAKLPTFATVRSTLEKTLAREPKFQAGDLISQSQVKRVLADLKVAGWTVAEGLALLANTPSDSEFLTVTLRSAAGQDFMRRIAKIPHGYDRVDRLSRIPRGEGTVRRLTTDTDGYKMIAYLAESPGGRNLGGMLAADQGGKDFNKPTGRIYTAAMLIERLEPLHAAAVKQAAAIKK